MTPNRAKDGDTLVSGLRLIMPPATLVHVGVGQGSGPMHQWHDWDIPAAWLVDAEPARMAWADKLVAEHTGWQVRAATLAEADGEAAFYSASNPAESGLVAVGKLGALWPNLRQDGESLRPTTSLDQLLACAGAPDDDGAWWLIVDCLPALRILRGAAATLERCGVLWLRTLLQPLPDAEPGTGVDELRDYLAPLGFRCIQLNESNHPAVGDALFVRDWARRLLPRIAELQAANQEQARRSRERDQEHGQRHAAQETALGALARERDARAALAREVQASLDALAAAHAEQSRRLAASEQAHGAAAAALASAESALAARSGERDAQARLASEAQGKLAQLDGEHAALLARLDTEAKASAELGARLVSEEQAHAKKIEALETAQRAAVAVLGQEKAALAEQLGTSEAARKELAGRCDTLQDQHDRLNRETEALGAALAARDAALAQLNGRIAEQEQRERQLVEDIVRAEAQIDLIKDLLLREDGL